LKILLTGRSGQVGAELERLLKPVGELVALDRGGLDLGDPAAIRTKVSQIRPALIVNAAAYTAVDRAESERAAAFAVNATAPEVLAAEARKLGALLVHFSTDYVFDGEKPTPYTEEDAPGPRNVYGESKLAGEHAIAASGCRALVLRTSWVYAPNGRNFLRAMLAAAQEKRALRVVDDQRGAPTPAHAIAAAVASLLSGGNAPEGLYHMSAAGEATWYEFAKAIFAARGIGTPVVPIPTREYRTAAVRPKNSILDNSKLKRDLGIALPHWHEGLAAVLSGIH
jgi:dTDP-4-dehydrorhamnose reductase